MNASYETLAEHFSLLPDSDERLRFLIQLGRNLPPLDEAERTEENLVRGCVSSVWLICERDGGDGATVLRFRGGSDAQIVSGLVSIVLSRYSGLSPEAILSLEPTSILAGFGLESELSPGRRNGLASMVSKIRQFAADALG
ncbi:MAG TPA: SufE family protein [Bacteroidia bacterium]|nr:SufE family protein [Bacteroidia bacterium]